jgi:hypothetical protein
VRFRPALSLTARAGVGTLVAATTVLGLTACTGAAAPTSAPTTASPTVTATSTPSPTPTHAPVALVPDGTARQNLPIFRKVVRHVWKSDDRVHGRAYVDALVEAGFAKKDMQVTEDLSTVGNPAETLLFSVRWSDGECLVGQVGPETGKPVTKVLPQLGDGKCLLGKTRAIDW